MDAGSSNQEIIMPPLPDKGDLKLPIREFIDLLEGLLCIKYPFRPPVPTPETKKKPILKEVTKLIIGYHYLTRDRDIAMDTTVYRWLGLRPEDVPSADMILKSLTKPHIVNALATHGLANYSLPRMLLKEDIPSPIPITLTGPRKRYSMEGYEKQSYVFTATSIVQAQISIKTQADILSGALSYRIDYTIGREGELSTSPSASIPFKEPIDLSVLLYNSLGADLHSFRRQIESIVREFDPMIIIITETRLPAFEAYQLAADINYMQVIASDSMNYNGGIWMFSSLKELLMREVNHTHNRLTVNLLRRWSCTVPSQEFA